MATVIRLARAGGKKKPVYHLVAADSRFPRDGRFIEKLGLFNPLTNPEILEINGERVDHWLSTGATPSETCHKLIKRWKKDQAQAAE